MIANSREKKRLNNNEVNKNINETATFSDFISKLKLHLF